MVLSERDNHLIAEIQDGLPLSSRPYREIGRRLGLSELQVIERISALQDGGVIKRMGIVVRHHELGYTANAMVVWDVPDDQVDSVGEKLGSQPCVTLCYQRPRKLPEWPYNLFCMIHGRERERVLEHIDSIVASQGLEQLPRKILFSGKRFKQRGAKYR
ncbi:MAG TPA: AsnC family transcriptional regulator [Gammaproteobacteria bacterium]|nr:AsnC family transcriptional regulator [Gammaproteobacteria bacterium]